MTNSDYVILVNEQDEAIGIEEKIKAHQLALLHRAFSICIFRKSLQLEVLLQRRHPDKYHCANLWTNTCCSHPRPDETVSAAAHRRLKEEMGFEAQLNYQGRFHYTASFDNGLVENEIDHVFTGIADPDVIQPNPTEVSEHRWIQLADLKIELQKTPCSFTPWFKQALNVALGDNLLHKL